MIKEENEVLEAALLAPETVITGNFLTVNTSAISLFNKQMGGGKSRTRPLGFRGWDQGVGLVCPLGHLKLPEILQNLPHFLLA